MPEGPGLSGARAVVVNWRDLDHALAGGSERYAWEFARALVDSGASVEFLTARDEGQGRTEVRDGIRIRRGGGALTFYPWAAWQLLRRRRRLDVVIDPECGIPTFSPLFVGRRTAVLLVVHHVHMQQFRTYFSPPMSTLGRWLEGWLMPRVYRRVPTYAVSRSTAAEMRKELGWRGPIGILENGSASATGASSGPGDPRRILVLGRLVPHKRVDAVVRAAALLTRDVPDLRVDVVGRGPEREAVRALVDDLGLSDVVTMHGYLSDPDMDAVLGGCGLHVCASDVEGWGQVVIDAASHGIPDRRPRRPRPARLDRRRQHRVARRCGRRRPSRRPAGGPGAGLHRGVVRSRSTAGVRPPVPDLGRALHLGPDARRGRAGHHRGPARAPATGQYY